MKEPNEPGFPLANFFMIRIADRPASYFGINHVAKRTLAPSEARYMYSEKGNGTERYGVFAVPEGEPLTAKVVHRILRESKVKLGWQGEWHARWLKPGAMSVRPIGSYGHLAVIDFPRNQTARAASINYLQPPPRGAPDFAVWEAVRQALGRTVAGETKATKVAKLSASTPTSPPPPSPPSSPPTSPRAPLAPSVDVPTRDFSEEADETEVSATPPSSPPSAVLTYSSPAPLEPPLTAELLGMPRRPSPTQGGGCGKSQHEYWCHCAGKEWDSELKRRKVLEVGRRQAAADLAVPQNGT
jgi:hypothetical protein